MSGECSWARVRAMATAAFLLIPVGIAIPRQQALAMQAQAHLDAALYVTHIDYSEARSDGCQEAGKDAQAGEPHSEIILDFGVQDANNDGVVLTKSMGVTATYSQVEQYAADYAAGFNSCSGNAGLLYLAVGTNNSTSTCCTTATGQTWGHVLEAVQSLVAAYSDVIVRGADDIEQWNTQNSIGFGYQPAFAWEQGFQSVPGYNYVNYGSANGCPYYSTQGGAGDVCSSNSQAYWDQHAYWWLTYGAPAAEGIPEIYYQHNANQWTEISYYGSVYQDERIYFDGPLDQYPTCSCTNTAAQAWSEFWGAVNYFPQTAQSFMYSEEIWDA